MKIGKPESFDPKKKWNNSAKNKYLKTINRTKQPSNVKLGKMHMSTCEVFISGYRLLSDYVI